MKSQKMCILAIETSCDETSVAIVENGSTVHSLVVNSQIDIHKAFGGVVPEVAARSHIEVMIPVVQQALDEAFPSLSLSHESGVTRYENSKRRDAHDSELTPHTPSLRQWEQIDAIAVTQGPGLLGSLLIGVLTARTLAWAKNKPLYPVHHILGHVYANWITESRNSDQLRVTSDEKGLESGSSLITRHLSLPKSAPQFPVLALIVSGGHTQLMYGTDHMNWKVIGRTIDDAVGEAFDKVAKVLGLPYPGGPSIAEVATDGDPKRYALPTPKTAEKYDYSFSGLKTAVLRAVQKECGKPHDFPSFELARYLNDKQKADFAASFQAKAIEYLVEKTRCAYDEYAPKSIIIGGGVAASLSLRKALTEVIPTKLEYAPQILCTDNAAMIGARAYFQAQSEDPCDPMVLEVKPSWPL